MDLFASLTATLQHVSMSASAQLMTCTLAPAGHRGYQAYLQWSFQAIILCLPSGAPFPCPEHAFPAPCSCCSRERCASSCSANAEGWVYSASSLHVGKLTCLLWQPQLHLHSGLQHTLCVRLHCLHYSPPLHVGACMHTAHVPSLEHGMLTRVMPTFHL